MQQLERRLDFLLFVEYAVRLASDWTLPLVVRSSERACLGREVSSREGQGSSSSSRRRRRRKREEEGDRRAARSSG